MENTSPVSRMLGVLDEYKKIGASNLICEKARELSKIIGEGILREWESEPDLTLIKFFSCLKGLSIGGRDKNYARWAYEQSLPCVPRVREKINESYPTSVSETLPGYFTPAYQLCE